jgi:hypothetical protein
MFRPRFQVTQLEDRSTPSSLVVLDPQFAGGAMPNVGVPPSDPMDNPPPVQPGTGGTGSTPTPPAPTPLPPPPPGTTP